MSVRRRRPISPASRLQEALCVVFTACLLPAPATAAPFEFADPFVTQGTGVALSVPRIVGAQERKTHLPKSIAAGDTISPIFQDVFPCTSLFCRRPNAGTLTVLVRRLQTPVVDDSGNDSTVLRRRAEEMLAAGLKQQEKSVLIDGSKKVSDGFERSLRTVRMDNGLWVYMQDLDAHDNSKVTAYWRVLSDNYTLTVSLVTYDHMLPPDVTIKELDLALSEFVARMVVAPLPATP